MSRTARPALVLLAAIAVLVAVTVVSTLPARTEGDPSSRSAGRLGTLALYTWFDRLGVPVHRISGNFDLHGTDVLVSYDPQDSYSSADVDAVMQHLRSGGDLILVVTPGEQSESLAAAEPLLQRLGVEQSGTTAPGFASPAQPFDAGDLVHRVRFGEGVGFLEGAPLVPLLREKSTVVAAVLQVENSGRVYLLGDTRPLSNLGLREADARWLVLSLRERARMGSGSVGFDEFHHGERSAATAGAGVIFNGPVGVATGLAFAVALLFLGLSGRRLGRPASGATVTSVPSASSYVAALGQLFARSRQRGAIAARYADELKRRIAELTGADAHRDDAAFVTQVGGAGETRAAALNALLARARALAAAQPSESALLHLAHDVDRFERGWADGAT
ncbi:MAG: DUF4350 domain-containing protein [Chloroflexi bacterium]|nr:MAG: DUF4350 domain-containing protein [Chloroflexota bacterium]